MFRQRETDKKTFSFWLSLWRRTFAQNVKLRILHNGSLHQLFFISANESDYRARKTFRDCHQNLNRFNWKNVDETLICWWKFAAERLQDMRAGKNATDLLQPCYSLQA